MSEVFMAILYNDSAKQKSRRIAGGCESPSKRLPAETATARPIFADLFLAAQKHR
jgi:hypothetical protein